MLTRYEKIIYRLGLSDFIGDEKANNRSKMIIESLSINLVSQLFAGNFLVGFLVAMGATDSFLGTFMLCASLGSVGQILSPIVFERLSRKKPLVITLRCIYYLLYIIITGILSIPSLKTDNTLNILLVTVMIANLLNSIAGPAQTAWHLQNLDAKTQNGYFSFLSPLVCFIVPIYSFLMGVVIDSIKVSVNELFPVHILRVVTLTIAIIEVTMLIKIKEYPYPEAPKHTSIVSMFSSVLKDKNYMLIVAIGSFWAMSANFSASYFSSYLISDLGMSYSWIFGISMASMPIMLFAAKLFSTFRANRTLFGGLSFFLIAYALTLLPQIFTQKNTLFLYPIAILVSTFFAPNINILTSQLPYVNLPENSKISYIGVYTTMTMVSVFVGNALSKLFIDVTEGVKLQIWMFSFGNKQLLNLLAIIFIIGLGIAIKILEKLKFKNS